MSFFKIRVCGLPCGATVDPDLLPHVRGKPDQALICSQQLPTIIVFIDISLLTISARGRIAVLPMTDTNKEDHP
jgi:hypothetical protein